MPRASSDRFRLFANHRRAGILRIAFSGTTSAVIVRSILARPVAAGRGRPPLNGMGPNGTDLKYTGLNGVDLKGMSLKDMGLSGTASTSGAADRIS